MSEIDKKITELRKACVCLYLEVPSSIAKDVERRAVAVIDQLKACREENYKLHEMENVEQFRRLLKHLETIEHHAKEAYKKRIWEWWQKEWPRRRIIERKKIVELMKSIEEYRNAE